MCLLCRKLRLYGNFLELLHYLNALSKSLSCLLSFVHFYQVSIHLIKVLVDELIDDLRRQVDPDVQDSILALAFKSIK